MIARNDSYGLVSNATSLQSSVAGSTNREGLGHQMLHEGDGDENKLIQPYSTR
jgi:hypothetical protein